jgi:filamentous hemagglutinin
MQELYDNAFDVYDEHPEYEVGKALTQSQIDNLSKDIIWLVAQTIDGHQVLAPVVYLAKATVERFKAKEIESFGSILKAGRDIKIDAINDITSHLSSITAGNDITLTSQEGNILVTNSILKSINKITLDAKKELKILSDSNLMFVSTNAISNSSSLKSGLNIMALSTTDPTPKTDANTTRTAISTFNAGSDILLTGANVTIANNTSQAGGSIFVTATAGNINNSNYQLVAGNNIVTTATGDVNNIHTKDGNGGQATLLQAGNALSIDAGGDTNNLGATITGENLVYLTAAGDINNEALIERNINGHSATKEQAQNSNADNITSSLVAKSAITSNSGNVVLVAANNINNTSSNITSGGQVYLEATGGDVNINTDTLRSRSVSRWHSKKNRGVSISDSTTNIASSITSGGNLNIISGNDTNILGSNVDVTGDLNNDATGNLNIKSVKDTNYQMTANYKRGSMGRRSSTLATTSTTTNKESNIVVSGNINIDIQKDINITASNLTASAGDVNLTAKGDVNIVSGQDKSETSNTSKKHGITTIAKRKQINRTITQITSNLVASNGEISLKSGDNTLIVASNLTSGSNTNIKVGSYIDGSSNETINNSATLRILNAMDSEYSLDESSKLGMDAGAIVVGIAAGAATGGIAGAVVGAYIGSQAQQGNIDMVEIYDETIKASKITSGNNINIEVASDALIRSSEFDSGNDVNIRVGSITDKNAIIQTTDANANLNITSTEERHIRNASHEKIKPDYVAIAGAAALSGAMISSGGLLMVAGGVSVAKASEDNALANRNMDESRLNKTDQISSKILTENDLNAISANNINIVASNATSNNGDLNFTSGGETNILSAIETSTLTTRSESQQFSDFTAGIDRGRASVGVNADINKETNSTTTSTVKSSNIAANNININATNAVTIQASNIKATNNVDVTSASGDVNLVSAANTTKNTQVKEELDATLSAGIGNAYVDTAYAVDDAAKAGEAVKDAKEELSHMKNLRNQGRATDEAVKDSEISLALAVTNFSIAAKLAYASGVKAVGAASTSLGTGFYGDVRLDMSGTKSTSNETIIENVASSIVAGNNVDLTSTSKDINQKGSHVTSTNGDITYNAGNDVNIEASKDTYDYKFGSETVNTSITLASSNPAAMVIDNIAG